jgi:hypothetical protein
LPPPAITTTTHVFTFLPNVKSLSLESNHKL